MCDGHEAVGIRRGKYSCVPDKANLGGQDKKEALEQLKKRKEELECELKQVNSCLGKILPNGTGDR